MSIKKNMRSLFYFGGYGKQDISASFDQMKANNLTKAEVWEKYRNLKPKDVLFFDFSPDGTTVTPVHLSVGDTTVNGGSKSSLQRKNKEDKFYNQQNIINDEYGPPNSKFYPPDGNYFVH
jgi:hypothetical protein